MGLFSGFPGSNRGGATPGRARANDLVEIFFPGGALTVKSGTSPNKIIYEDILIVPADATNDLSVGPSIKYVTLEVAEGPRRCDSL